MIKNTYDFNYCFNILLLSLSLSLSLSPALSLSPSLSLYIYIYIYIYISSQKYISQLKWVIFNEVSYVFIHHITKMVSSATLTLV